MAISFKTTSGKILASVALVGTAAAVAGMGTYGAFTSSTSASQAVTAGTVTIALGAPGAANTLNVPVTNILPGDKVEKLVTLANTGNSDLNNITLTTNAGTTASQLTTDATNGLQLTIENCSVAWTGTAAPYTCASTKTTVLANGPVIAANKTLNNLTALTNTKTDNLKVTTTLPTTADNTFQGATSTIAFAFTGTQRTETTK
ncbi:putative ribosomally synthesized peptide with SipW-like signal peptide [Paenarthrobacter ilicis]|uniref:Ribosomally synthesized peptide with SipW-like signal peptide n=1 Tax=Paenarthrobacter ilicis TaxID=43665 RepID=A0ABX0TG14_9MICC|nr:TasA family protein [Paenarthrobacter ilicis]MBM7791938.1 putative ribosomally synthesized peptide with SipW-like signal peptide [Paenarthrobacter ilicis]NIJ01437.1 putative ribosomally synthesized peptide with SipW-like signal peptide [Paenarthrobacter ilicis]